MQKQTKPHSQAQPKEGQAPGKNPRTETATEDSSQEAKAEAKQPAGAEGPEGPTHDRGKAQEGKDPAEQRQEANSPGTVQTNSIARKQEKTTDPNRHSQSQEARGQQHTTTARTRTQAQRDQAPQSRKDTQNAYSTR